LYGMELGAVSRGAAQRLLQHVTGPCGRLLHQIPHRLGEVLCARHSVGAKPAVAGSVIAPDAVPRDRDG